MTRFYLQATLLLPICFYSMTGLCINAKKKILCLGLIGIKNAHARFCEPPVEETALSGTYLIEAALPLDEDHPTDHKHIFEDDNGCVYPLEGGLENLDAASNDRVENLVLLGSDIIASNATQVMHTKYLRKSSNRPISINRAIFVFNDILTEDQVKEVMDDSAQYFFDQSRSKIQMKFTYFFINEVPSCSLVENKEKVKDYSSLNSYDKVTFVAKFNCGWGGIAYINGRLSSVSAGKTMSGTKFIEVHETGHLIDGGHADSPEKEYGDHNDPLGNSFKVSGFNAPHLYHFKFLNVGERQEIDADTAERYYLYALDNFHVCDRLKVLDFIDPKVNDRIFFSFRKSIADVSYSGELKHDSVLEVHKYFYYMGGRSVILERLKVGDSYSLSDGSSLKLEKIDGKYAYVSFVGSNSAGQLLDSQIPNFNEIQDEVGSDSQTCTNFEGSDSGFMKFLKDNYPYIGAGSGGLFIITVATCYKYRSHQNR